MKRLLVALLFVGFVVGACGDDGSLGGSTAPVVSGEEKEAADEIAASFRDEDNGFGSEVTDAQAACVGAKLVKAFGVRRVREMKLESDEPDMTEAEAEKAADAVVDCVDLRQAFAQGMAEGGEISQKSADCLANKLSNADIKQMLVSTFQGEDDDDVATDLYAKLLGAMGDCLTAAELKSMGE
ncbi:MAG TPA: hypothetical protein VGQ20_04245 [Acidimicrobiales bacterium]|jgi:hypothetical protein|nr:hypothetical protein [Acidimicrobiales bacterium]